MSKKATISAIFLDEEPLLPQGRHIRGTPISFLKKHAVELNKETLSNSLSTVIEDMEDILTKTKIKTEKVELKEVSISVEANVNGGFQWIAKTNIGLTNSMTLTFKLKS